MQMPQRVALRRPDIRDRIMNLELEGALCARDHCVADVLFGLAMRQLLPADARVTQGP